MPTRAQQAHVDHPTRRHTPSWRAPSLGFHPVRSCAAQRMMQPGEAFVLFSPMYDPAKHPTGASRPGSATSRVQQAKIEEKRRAAPVHVARRPGRTQINPASQASHNPTRQAQACNMRSQTYMCTRIMRPNPLSRKRMTLTSQPRLQNLCIPKGQILKYI